ncbi:hypothetical protein [Methylosinus sp. PW1]|uniref:hypothetical protein n=1 Tax=Methylosinus sp. PW1 TaxID=107636 RepID=UPI00056080F1|nr:hypothetical protein [Methylosinus sp. PW1]
MSIDIKENPAFTAKKYVSFVAAHLAHSIGVPVEEIAPGLQIQGSETHDGSAASINWIDDEHYADPRVIVSAVSGSPTVKSEADILEVGEGVVARIAELEENNRNLGARLDEKSLERANLVRNIAARDREIADLKRDLNAKDTEISKLKVELHDTAQGYTLRKVISKALEQVLAKKDAEIERLEFDLADMTAARDGRQKNFDRLLEKVRAVTRQITSINASPGIAGEIEFSGIPRKILIPTGFASSIMDLWSAERDH